MEPSNDAYFASTGSDAAGDDVPPADASTAAAAAKAEAAPASPAGDASSASDEGEPEEAKGTESAKAATTSAAAPASPASPATGSAGASESDPSHVTPAPKAKGKGGKEGANPLASPIPEMVMSAVRKLGPVVFTPTDVLMWRNPAISGAAFALGFAGIYFGPLAIIELALLLAVLAGGTVKLNNAWGVPSKAPLPVPRVPLTREGLDGFVEGLADALVAAIAFLNGVMAWKDSQHSLRAMAYVWLLFTFGGLSVLLLNTMLQQAAFVALFAVPVVWADLKAAAVKVTRAQVAPLLEQLQAHVTKGFAAVSKAVEGKSATVVAAASAVGLALFAYLWLQLLPLRSLATFVSLSVVAYDLAKAGARAAGVSVGAGAEGAASATRPKSD